jgi:DMSO/TMAO reductase YedYZ molybdopterin-dependent catalytic subunit
MEQPKSPRMSRRALLKLSPVLLLGGFAVPSLRDGLLAAGVGFTDRATDLMYRGGHLAPTFAAADAVPFERFPYNGYGILEPAVDFPHWSLNVGGAVAKPGQYTLEHIRALPKIQQNTRHICVEGWEAIGKFGGARLGEFLAMVGADPHARFVTVTCADDYYESLDMPTALQPQSLLCYEMYDKPLDAGHGAPLRLQLPTKLGYKQAKYVMTLNVLNVLPARRSYWGDQGYSWYGGL